MTKRTSVIIPFDMIVDIDYGIVKVMSEEFSNAEYINSEMVKQLSDDELLYNALIGRNCSNIVELILKKEYTNSAQLIKDQLIEEDYMKIIKNSSITNITNLVKSYVESGLVDVTVLVSNQIEKDIIIQSLPKANVQIVSDLNMIDLSQYNAIFLKDIEDAKKLNTAGMTIYMGNYRFNYQDNNDQNVHNLVPKQTYKQGTVIKSVDVYSTSKEQKIM